MATPQRISPTPTISAKERRTIYLEIMRRRARPGSGSSQALLRSRESYPTPDLNALLPNVRYAVVGGTATSLYMALRTTKDIDILVLASDAAAAESALAQAGATLREPLNIDNPLQIEGNSWKLSDGSDLEVLRSARPWVKAALAHPERDAAGLPIISVPYLILMKLASGHGVDMGDLSRILGGAENDALDKARKVVRKYLPDALDDLESLIELGRLEFQ